MNNGAMNKDIELKISELEKTLEKLRILELRISKFRSETSAAEIDLEASAARSNYREKLDEFIRMKKIDRKYSKEIVDLLVKKELLIEELADNWDDDKTPPIRTRK